MSVVSGALNRVSFMARGVRVGAAETVTDGRELRAPSRRA